MTKPSPSPTPLSSCPGRFLPERSLPSLVKLLFLNVQGPLYRCSSNPLSAWQGKEAKPSAPTPHTVPPRNSTHMHIFHWPSRSWPPSCRTAQSGTASRPNPHLLSEGFPATAQGRHQSDTRRPAPGHSTPQRLDQRAPGHHCRQCQRQCRHPQSPMI
jgi:hypothetical protein